MSNLHPTKDMIETPQCNREDNSNQFRKKIQHLQFLLKKIELAHEGHQRSYSYANAEISEQLRNEGVIQQKFYNILFSEALEALIQIGQEMHAKPTSNKESQ